MLLINVNETTEHMQLYLWGHKYPILYNTELTFCQSVTDDELIYITIYM